MNSSHICLACRRKLSQPRLRTPIQWLPKGQRASFISLSNPSLATKDSSNHNPIEAETDRSQKNEKISRDLPATWKQNRPAPSARPGSDLESLFEHSIKNRAPSTTKQTEEASSLSLYENADILKNMILDGSCSAVNCWQFAMQHFGPDAWKKGSIDRISAPSYLYAREGGYFGKSLIMKVTLAKDNDPISNTLPSYTQITRVYLQLGILNGSDWTKMILGLIHNILKHKDTLPNTIEEQSLILDLLGSWNLIFRRKEANQNYSTLFDTTLDWSEAPAATLGDVKHAYVKRGLIDAFGFLAPKLPIKQINDLPLAATATFALLTLEPKISQSTIQNASPLVTLLGRLLNQPFLKSHQFARHGYPDAVFASKFVETNWSQIKEQALLRSVTRHAVTETRANRTFNYTHKKLQDAFKQKNVKSVDNIWAEVMNYPIHKEVDATHQDIKSSPQGTLTSGICNYLIMIYMALRRPNSAIDVWNHMVNVGFPPTLSTWNHMLLGCSQCRDPVAMEGIWSRMQALNIRPDVVCWTTRINGLIECGRIEEAVRALDEMGRLWLIAARSKYGNKKVEALHNIGDIEDVVKPTIATVNAALTGLFRKQKLDVANRILVWAGQFGLRADNITYNILLRPLVRDGRMNEVHALLQKMEQDGVQADVATFTIILEETLHYSEGRSVEEQQKILSSVFSEMQAAGVQPNVQTYNRIIHQLLLSDSSDTTAVNAVMARMAKQGIQAGPHVHTMLAEFHFSRSPPNLEAVRTLIDRARANPASVDHIFWCRVIEGYAWLGDTTSAVRILNGVNASGMAIGWLTLEHVLTAVAHNGEWDTARTIVRNAQLDTGRPLPTIHEDVNEKPGKLRFWKLAHQLGLLESSSTRIIK